MSAKVDEQAAQRDDVDEIELALLLEGVYRRYGFDFREYAPADITLSNMRSNGINTFYRATTPQGQYACAAETGMSKVIALGLTSPPSCYKEATIDGGTDTK
jgi:hypothetical protein